MGSALTNELSRIVDRHDPVAKLILWHQICSSDNTDVRQHDGCHDARRRERHFDPCGPLIFKRRRFPIPYTARRMKDKLGNVVWICRSVVCNECATPRVADKNESFGANLLTDRFKVGNESLHGVVASLGKLTGQARANLIEEIDAESILCELAVEGMVCIEGAKTRPPRAQRRSARASPAYRREARTRYTQCESPSEDPSIGYSRAARGCNADNG